ncbi:MAG: aromatic acid exporter family protein [Streptococcaceae bacterium]|jgi:uncharacterized membrane protein YgaE (UPF0421/DUF939 family)|nr:aromatic acid exporter family protein [Streptococcaceae bacterium]
MKLGMRTIKTVISATFALLIANLLHLEFAPTAAIIAILSVSSTKKSTLKISISRVVSLSVALLMATILFNTLGHHAVVFGLYLLLFIPLSMELQVEEGIVVSSVLITHLLLSPQITGQLIVNEYLLMITGAGLATLINVYMPDVTRVLRHNQEILDSRIRNLSMGIVTSVRNNRRLDLQRVEVRELLEFTADNIEKSRQAMENRIFSSEHFYFDYFRMRQMQLVIFQEILQELHELTIQPEFFSGLAKLFLALAKTFDKDNDAQHLSIMVSEVFEEYRQMPLPKTREEFELRARLYRILQLIETLIDIKRDFVENRSVNK